ncbi:hypothetical protein [Jannaschia seohaensis]|uniref:Uncharacterized protein n=1 Tax=Jannaschia seohaensis TaxID=475081 RepID=A0A2Y9AYU1_9RHOB|nr:hypothetical protein [Jannaschia seohaensis]PWJ16238.1 hypothetical protein BCF38_109123 [Jannaschia seohaensis]SSA49306.1 hypothetical protein SAMN05421539_109123 [Jannaschia seohaensis]
MAYLNTNASAATLGRLLEAVRSLAPAILQRMRPQELDGQSLLEAQARAEQARARVDRLLR